MKLNVIQIGNSKGIRLPKALFDEYQLNESVELVLKKDYFEIHPHVNPRSNWSKELQKMAKDQNEELLIPDVFEDEEL